MNNKLFLHSPADGGMGGRRSPADGGMGGRQVSPVTT